MIQGEIYCMNECTFAYESEGDSIIFHYICLNQYNQIKVRGVSGIGTLSKCGKITIANDRQRERFFREMKRQGFWYNQTNKSVFYNGIKVL